MADLLEVFMVVSFGFSWPISIAKSYRAGTAKGKSLVFLVMIMFGYTCGILSKVLGGKTNYVVVFYLINLFMVGIDLLLYMRNARRDALETARIGDAS